MLGAAVTDKTFSRTQLDGKTVWVGKCIFCNTKLVVADDGQSLGEATLEHIFPQAQGGGNELSNLAVACGRCNREKGRRHDHTVTQRADEVVAALRERRMSRWREPDTVGMANRLAAVIQPEE